MKLRLRQAHNRVIVLARFAMGFLVIQLTTVPLTPNPKRAMEMAR